METRVIALIRKASFFAFGKDVPSSQWLHCVKWLRDLLVKSLAGGSQSGEYKRAQRDE